MSRLARRFNRNRMLSVIAKRHGVRGPIRFSPAPPRVDPDATAPGHASASGMQAELMTLPRPPFAVRVLNHLTYGVTPSLLAEFNALGTTDAARLSAFLDRQLNPAGIDDSAVDARLTAAGYTTLGKSLTQLWADHVLPDPAYDVRMRPAFEVQRSSIVRAVHSKRQLLEVMCGFWHNHFNVACTDFNAGPVFMHYHRDVIRANALGNFRNMLEAVAQSTSMMYYLDNESNTRAGPNENFARELLELHTMGAENYLGFMDPFKVPKCPEDPNYPIGYTDVDVYETSSSFTGWSVKDGHWQYPTENDGTFVYRQAWHDAGPKFVLGMFLNPEQPAMKDGRDILDRLASHPRAAKYICRKLIRRFVSDRPDPALVDSAATVFRANWQQPDQIARTLRHIFQSDAFLNSWGMKNRRPFELLVAALRGLGTDWTPKVGDGPTDTLFWRLGFTGNVPYEWPAPNGYPDTGLAWSGSSAYAMTWKMLDSLTEALDANNTPIGPILDATRTGVSSWTANNLVDFWCRKLLGYLPAPARRQLLVAFMAQNGDPASYVITDTDTWSMSDLKKHYNQQRLRSLVAMILMSPEFISR